MTRLRDIVSVRVRLAMLVIAAACAFTILAVSGSFSTHQVEDWFDDVGWAGPLVFIAVSSLLTVACFPGPLLAGAAGLLFGTALGTMTAIVAATLGATMACAIGRFVAGDAVEELGGPRVRAFAAWVGRRGFLSVLYARIAPGIPYNVVNYACGLTTIPFVTFAAATAIGIVPRTFAYAALGGSLGHLDSPEALIAVAVLVGMAIIGLIVARRDLQREREAAARRRSSVGADLVGDPGGADA
jgi:uncharacterized membrane protein YdjX (TVP38/TMEM64 family)